MFINFILYDFNWILKEKFWQSNQNQEFLQCFFRFRNKFLKLLWHIDIPISSCFSGIQEGRNSYKDSRCCGYIPTPKKQCITSSSKSVVQKFRIVPQFDRRFHFGVRLTKKRNGRLFLNLPFILIAYFVLEKLFWHVWSSKNFLDSPKFYSWYR